MNIPLLLQMLRGEWALDINSVDKYALLVHRLIESKEIKIDPKAFQSTFFDENGAYNHRTEDGVRIREKSKAVFRIEGEVLKSSDFCTVGAVEIASHINHAAQHKNVDGIILEIDSPGGQATAVHPIATAIANANKPVIAVVESALSLGYWVASSADMIILKDEITGSVGSIGVMLSFMDYSEYLEEKGIKTHIVIPPESKHKNEAFLLALEGKYDKINAEVLSPMALKFQNHVRDARGAKLKEAEGVLTGKTFYADKALEYGLIDKVGTLEDAFRIIDVMNEIKQ